MQRVNTQIQRRSHRPQLTDRYTAELKELTNRHTAFNNQNPTLINYTCIRTHLPHIKISNILPRHSITAGNAKAEQHRASQSKLIERLPRSIWHLTHSISLHQMPRTRRCQTNHQKNRVSVTGAECGHTRLASAPLSVACSFPWICFVVLYLHIQTTRVRSGWDQYLGFKFSQGKSILRRDSLCFLFCGETVLSEGDRFGSIFRRF